MRTSAFSETHDFAGLKQDVRSLADDTMKAARQHVVDPAVDAAHRAQAYARDAMHDAKVQMSRQLSNCEHYASEGYDRTERWIAANPFKAVGVALAIGLVIASFFETSSKRR